MVETSIILFIECLFSMNQKVEQEILTSLLSKSSDNYYTISLQSKHIGTDFFFFQELPSKYAVQLNSSEYFRDLVGTPELDTEQLSMHILRYNQKFFNEFILLY